MANRYKISCPRTDAYTEIDRNDKLLLQNEQMNNSSLIACKRNNCLRYAASAAANKISANNGRFFILRRLVTSFAR